MLAALNHSSAPQMTGGSRYCIGMWPEDVRGFARARKLGGKLFAFLHKAWLQSEQIPLFLAMEDHLRYGRVLKPNEREPSLVYQTFPLSIIERKPFREH
ncbi:MAG TPA: hypothetical protein VNU44_21230 [Bryobacteraceae bacterium]|jgi:hypothetical protein|nr:hypothetical protein [Bryobacteraceae bacterium]